jgi:hypothetical protein
VANDIEVKLPSERTDPDIAAAAIRAIEWDAAVPSDKVQVTVSKGGSLSRMRVSLAKGISMPSGVTRWFSMAHRYRPRDQDSFLHGNALDNRDTTDYIRPAYS